MFFVDLSLFNSQFSKCVHFFITCEFERILRKQDKNPLKPCDKEYVENVSIGLARQEGNSFFLGI